MAKPRTKHRRCSFESLENRRMLAGDLSVIIFKGKLAIIGDRLDNAVSLTAGMQPNQVVVSGMTAGGSATGINGTPNGTVTLPNFVGDLKIAMKDGNDSVTINNLPIKGNTKINMGKGIDVLTINGSTAGGKTKINTGSGSDMLTVSSSVVKGTAKIKTKGGNDMVVITNTTFRTLDTKLGKGNDMVAISGTTAAKTILNGGKGVNTFTNGTNNFLFNTKISKFV